MGCFDSQHCAFTNNQLTAALSQGCILNVQNWYYLEQREGDLGQHNRSWRKIKENKVVQYVFSWLFDQSSLSRCFIFPTAVKVLAGNSCPVAPSSNCLSKAVLAEDFSRKIEGVAAEDSRLNIDFYGLKKSLFF